eukprot:4184497-Pyramimonas_sp.AAC.1
MTSGSSRTTPAGSAGAQHRPTVPLVPASTATLVLQATTTGTWSIRTLGQDHDHHRHTWATPRL